jgi:broad specificity phosphatase PhoE
MIPVATSAGLRMTYLLLMRHGAHECKPDVAGWPLRVLTAKGTEQVEEVASALEQFIAETEDLPDHRLVPTQIWYATSAEATQTAVILHQRLAQSRAVGCVQKEALIIRAHQPLRPGGKP